VGEKVALKFIETLQKHPEKDKKFSLKKLIEAAKIGFSIAKGLENHFP
jgi:hypothetical protein